MAMKWVCAKCKERFSDGQSDDPKMARNPHLHKYQGICPLCGGRLKPIKKAKK